MLDCLFPGMTSAELVGLFEAADEVRVRHSTGPELASLIDIEGIDNIEDVIAAFQYRGGEAKLVGSYTHEGQYESVAMKGIGPRELKHLYRMGMTVCLNNAHRTFKNLWEWTVALEVALNLPPGAVQINAYASPPGSGLAKHLDNHSVVVVQALGQKTWLLLPNTHVRYPTRGYNTQVPPPPPELAYANLDEVTPEMPGADRVEMVPGSVLFVPSGYWHATESQQEHSLSLSIGFYMPFYYDLVIAKLKDELRKREEWRRPVVGVWGNKNQRSRAAKCVQGMLAPLRNIVASLDADDMVSDYTMSNTEDELSSPRFPERPQYCLVSGATVNMTRDSDLHLLVTANDDVSDIEIPLESEPVVSAILAQSGYFSQRAILEQNPDANPALVAGVLELMVEAGVLSG